MGTLGGDQRRVAGEGDLPDSARHPGLVTGDSIRAGGLRKTRIDHCADGVPRRNQLFRVGLRAGLGGAATPPAPEDRSPIPITASSLRGTRRSSGAQPAGLRSDTHRDLAVPFSLCRLYLFGYTGIEKIHVFERVSLTCARISANFRMEQTLRVFHLLLADHPRVRRTRDACSYTQPEG